MKNSLLMGMLLLILFCQAFGQARTNGLEGSWQGTLEAGGAKLRVVLTLTRSDSGTYAGDFNSLDQGAIIPIDTITVDKDAVRLEIKSASIVYEGVLNKERTEMAGTFTQGGQAFPLTFKRGEPAAASNPTRPALDAMLMPGADSVCPCFYRCTGICQTRHTGQRWLT